ncbi:MAG: flotillin family protein [Planctomycetota bacterium]|jgi:flotillin|nr:flotillin family protein [Planctomycetota bacterium]
MEDFPGLFGLVVVPALIVFAALVFVARQYRRCPSNMVLVVYGNVGGNKTAKCIHGGGTFIIPLIQDFRFLSLEPLTTEIDLRGALSKKNIRVNVPSSFTIAIATEPNVMLNAAERLLGLGRNDIINQANDIIVGQLRLVIATLSIEEINQDREKFLDLVNVNVNIELNKIGLDVINVNIRDITDESGYIDAIGKKAAAEAINQAKVEVAQQIKLGEVGEAIANREKEVQVAEQRAQAEIGKITAQREQRIRIAGLDADAVIGENTAKAQIADSDAELAVKRAAALRLGEVARANSERDVLIAQKEQEEAKLKKEELARQEVEKLKTQVMADAEAEKLRRIALGEADAVRARYFAESEGVKAVLEAKAHGYQRLAAICASRPELATSFLMIEKIEAIVAKQVEAIKNIKFDKITVWDGGSGQSGGGAAANFMRDLIRSLPAMHDLAAQAGIELPELLGKVGPATNGNMVEKGSSAVPGPGQ